MNLKQIKRSQVAVLEYHRRMAVAVRECQAIAAEAATDTRVLKGDRGPWVGMADSFAKLAERSEEVAAG